jgi:mannose/cellobiose epimerase-like protein (N-acyl-D-glucosamine 2-epimerase family)
LFGLAAAARVRPDGSALAIFAQELLGRMMAHHKHPLGGFEESQPRSLPLKANPHMHILEASLAWAEISSVPVGGGPAWGALADEIAELCLRCFLDPATGALREYFGGDWRQINDHAGSVVEPGHQLEWAWLLFRWGRLRGRADAIATARRLIEIADRHGTDPARDLAINELNADLTWRDPLARLWPQTERIKAFVMLGRMAGTAAEADAAFATAARAAAGLRRYWEHPIRGCWWEHMAADGKPVIEPTRASSLYHIVCAISEMERADDAV